MDKIRNRKQPGQVRVVNFSNAPLQLYWQEREVDSAAAPGTNSRFRTIAVGDQELVLKSGDSPVLTVPLSVETEKNYSIVAYGAGSSLKFTVIEGENEYPTNSQNIQAFFIDGNGKVSSGELSLSVGSNKYNITDKGAPQTVSAGRYSLSGSGLSGIEGELIADTAYSIFIFKDGSGKSSGQVVQNTFREQPIAGGAT